MRLNRIVLSGANEYTDAEALISLCGKLSFVEIGIQVSGDKAFFGSARYWWIHTLVHYSSPKIPLALHLNKNWVEDFCTGKLPPELETFLKFRHHNGKPVFERIQLNFKIGREKTPDMDTLLATMRRYQPGHKFILSYNDSNKEFIRQIYKSGFAIDALLHDSSFGEGISPAQRAAPVFADVYQGYAGGLSPDNVTDELDKINAVVPRGKCFFIDAEGKLKGEDGHLSLAKCEKFVSKASFWAYERLFD